MAELIGVYEYECSLEAGGSFPNETIVDQNGKVVECDAHGGFVIITRNNDSEDFEKTFNVEGLRVWKGRRNKQTDKYEIGILKKPREWSSNWAIELNTRSEFIYNYHVWTAHDNRSVIHGTSVVQIKKIKEGKVMAVSGYFFYAPSDSGHQAKPSDYYQVVNSGKMVKNWSALNGGVSLQRIDPETIENISHKETILSILQNKN